MIPNLWLRLFAKKRHDLCIRRTVTLVAGEEQTIGLLSERIDAGLACPGDTTTTEGRAGRLEQMPLAGLLVGHGEQVDQRLEDERDEPGHEGVWAVAVEAAAHVARVDPAGTRVDESDVRVVDGQLLERRRVHGGVVYARPDGAKAPGPAHVEVVEVDAARPPLHPAAEDADDPPGLGGAQQRQQEHHRQHARVVLERLDDLEALGGLVPRPERRIPGAEKEEVDARLARRHDRLAHALRLREQRRLGGRPHHFRARVHRRQLRDQHARALLRARSADQVDAHGGARRDQRAHRRLADARGAADEDGDFGSVRVVDQRVGRLDFGVGNHDGDEDEEDDGSK